jgi:hypothetical protein
VGWVKEQELFLQQLEEAKSIIHEIEEREILRMSTAEESERELRQQVQAKAKERQQIRNQRLEQWQQRV